jgi:hypothetical protein
VSAVPVVPGDDRVACQHCPARVMLVTVDLAVPGPYGPNLAWTNPDSYTPEQTFWCTPGIWHKPMPTVRVTR